MVHWPAGPNRYRVIRCWVGLFGSTAALTTMLMLATVINWIGIGFLRGTHIHWQLITDDATGAPRLTDIGASFGIATSGF